MSPRHDRIWLTVAVLVWCITFVVVCALVLRGGTYNTITYDVYVAATQHWWARTPLYDVRSADDFQYLPHAAVLFSPFVYVGASVGGVAWRALCWGLLAHGVWRVARQLAPERVGMCFLLTTASAVGPSINSLGIGQANLLVAALTLQVAADLIERRFWRAAALLALGLAAKPLMVVMLLLVWVLYRPTHWRVPVVLALLFVLPFLASDSAYVLAQYRAFLTKSRSTADPHRLFEDANGLVTTLGWTIPALPFFGLRLLAALATLGLAARARKVFREPHATMHVTALAVTYLMLFNPRTQSNSYSIAAPVAALLAATYLLGRRWLAAATTFVVVLCWSGNSHRMVWPELWLKPLACVGFAALLAWELLRRPEARSTALAPPVEP